MTDPIAIAAGLTELDEYLAAMGGCGDGHCIIVKPNGQHTNGGCSCYRNGFQMQKFAYAHNRFALLVRQALKEMGDA
jgi:hypothetical protein